MLQYFPSSLLTVFPCSSPGLCLCFLIVSLCLCLCYLTIILFAVLTFSPCTVFSFHLSHLFLMSSYPVVFPFLIYPLPPLSFHFRGPTLLFRFTFHHSSFICALFASPHSPFLTFLCPLNSCSSLFHSHS